MQTHPTTHPSNVSHSLRLGVALGLGTAGAFAQPVLDNFVSRPNFGEAAVIGTYGIDKEFQITDRSWTAVRVTTGPVTTPGNVFQLSQVQIYISGTEDAYDGETWGLTMQVRENGFGPFADPEVDTPNAASGAVLGRLTTNGKTRDFNPGYSVFGSGGTLTDINTYVFTPATPIELLPNTVYWFSATSDEPGDRIRWQAATANGQKSLAFATTGGWSLGAQTSDYTVGEAEFWDEPLPPGTFDLPLLIAIHALEAPPSPIPEPARASLVFGLLGLAWTATRRRRRG